MSSPRPARSPRRLAAAAVAPLALAALAPAAANAQPYPYPDEAPLQAVDQSGPYPADSGTVDADPRTLAAFREPLAAYGSWVNDPRYGTVWVPSPEAVGSDFVPYRTHGHWEVLPDGRWYWQSDYPFGGITFHYGRWAYLPSLGWSWIPGSQWSPAWVDWSVNNANNYVGWAPSAPTYYWSGGVALSWPWSYEPYWSYVAPQYAFSPYVSQYVVPQAYAYGIAAGARVVPYYGIRPYVSPYLAGARIHRYVGGVEGYDYSTGRYLPGYGPRGYGYPARGYVAYPTRGYAGYAGRGYAYPAYGGYGVGYAGRGYAYPAYGGYGYHRYVGGAEGYDYSTGRYLPGYGPRYGHGYVGAPARGYVGYSGRGYAYPAYGGHGGHTTGGFYAAPHVAPTPTYARPHYQHQSYAVPHAAAPSHPVGHAAPAGHAASFGHAPAGHAPSGGGHAVHSAPSAGGHGGGGGHHH